MFFIVAQLFFLCVSTVFSIAVQGYLEYNEFVRYGILAGSLIEMILFSLALGYRIKIHEEEKIKIITKANENLDIKVKQRTKKLEDLANKDYMTNLYNRRFLFKVSEDLIKVAKKENTPLSIIIFDIDNFKSINDTYGHNVGDIIIKRFAKILKQLQDSYICSRFGGEEFVVLLPNTNKKDTFNIATEIKNTIEKLTIKVDEKNSLNFTISGGVDSLKPNTNIDELIHTADMALYEAKKNGRNQIILSKN